MTNKVITSKTLHFTIDDIAYIIAADANLDYDEMSAFAQGEFRRYAKKLITKLKTRKQCQQDTKSHMPKK